MSGAAGVAEEAAESVQKSPIRCYCVGQSDSAAVQRIKAVLDKPLTSVGLDFLAVPLEEVAAFLQEEYEIPIQIDVEELESAGISVDGEVSVNLRDMSLKAALRLMLKKMDLTYVISDEVLLITTREAGETYVVTCVYDVREVVPMRRGRPDFKPLIEAITACVAPKTWAAHGGARNLKGLPSGLLVVSQTQDVHEEISGLLEGLRKLQQQEQAAQGRLSFEEAKRALTDP